MKNWKRQAAAVVRKVTSPFPLRRKLPPDLGGASLIVSSSSDVRLLSPSLETSSAELFEVARKYINPGDVIWDIGGNLGLFAFPAAAKAGSTGQVYALEADSRHVELMLKSRATLPAGYSPVTILCAAAADSHSLVHLNIVSKGHSRNFLDSVRGNDAGDVAETKAVVAVTADWLLEHWRTPTFVKVDIEGAEILFLKGASRLISEVRPVFYIEVNEENQDEATSLFHAAGYQLFGEAGPAHSPALTRCDFNTLAVPAGHALLKKLGPSTTDTTKSEDFAQSV